MGLFYNNNVSGRGVAKNGPKKKPFFRFWELFFNKFGTFFKLNLIYLLFCLPVVTIGPATAALTAMMRNIYLERPQFIWHDFVKYFKKNFKQGLVVGLIDIAAAVIFALLFYQYNNISNPDAATNIMYIISLAVLVMFLMMNFYIYPQIAALNLNLVGIFKNSLIMVFVNLPGELIVLAVIIGFASLFWFFFIPAVFLAPFLPGAWIVFISVFCCYPAIQKHLINPYYEKTGERNPEIPDWELEDEDAAVFQDQGGKEQPIKLKREKKKNNGRVIK